MFIIGITGGSGAGKTSAMTAIEASGAKAIDCDALYHELLSDNDELTAEISEYFLDVLTDGKVDRKKLGAIVFNDKGSLLKLNSITHKFVAEALNKRIESYKTQGIEVVAIDAIALIESGLSSMCNIVVGVVAPIEARLSRIINRDGLTKEKALMRINAQKPESFFRENCDYIIENNFKTSAEFEAYCKDYFETKQLKFERNGH